MSEGIPETNRRSNMSDSAAGPLAYRLVFNAILCISVMFVVVMATFGSSLHRSASPARRFRKPNHRTKNTQFGDASGVFSDVSVQGRAGVMSSSYVHTRVVPRPTMGS
jgi:hypothetical protein